jgi:hypothetical protein
VLERYGQNHEKIAMVRKSVQEPRRHLWKGSDWQTLDVDLWEETYQKVLRDGVPCSTSIPIPYSLEALKIVVCDVGNDKVGSVIRRIH